MGARIAAATDVSLFGQWPIVGNSDIKQLAKAQSP
jgi:hypothetical protein